MIRAPAALALAPALVLVLAACGNSGDPPLAIGGPTSTDAGGNPITPADGRTTGAGTGTPSPGTPSPGKTRTGTPRTGAPPGATSSSGGSGGGPPTSYPCGPPPAGTQDGRTPQKIRFTKLGALFWPNRKVTLQACSTSGLPVSFTLLPSGDSTYCSMKGGVLRSVRVLPLGCRVQASQPGDGRYAAATPVVRTLRIRQQIINVTWVTAPHDVTAGTPLALSAKASSPSGSLSGTGAFVSAESASGDVCAGPPNGARVQNGRVSFTVTTNRPGDCTVNVSISGDETTDGGSAGKRTFTVSAPPSP